MTENAQMFQCLSCNIHGKSCYPHRDDTIAQVLCFVRFKPVLTGLNRFKHHVWQKQVYADRKPTLMCIDLCVGQLSVRHSFKVAVTSHYVLRLLREIARCVGMEKWWIVVCGRWLLWFDTERLSSLQRVYNSRLWTGPKTAVAVDALAPTEFKLRCIVH